MLGNFFATSSAISLGCWRFCLCSFFRFLFRRHWKTLPNHSNPLVSVIGHSIAQGFEDGIAGGKWLQCYCCRRIRKSEPERTRSSAKISQSRSQHNGESIPTADSAASVHFQRQLRC